MKTMNFQILKEQNDLNLYQKLTAQRVDVELPMDYLERAKVVGLKDSQTQQIYGGFTMAYQGPLRCIEQIPKNHSIPDLSIQEQIDSCFEINGLWLNHRETNENYRFQLYLACMREAIKLSFMGKNKYVYAFCAENEKLKKFYKNFNSKKLYEGPVTPLPGMKKSSHEIIEIGCMKKLPLTIARNPLFLVSRAFDSKLKKFKWT